MPRRNMQTEPASKYLLPEVVKPPRRRGAIPSGAISALTTTLSPEQQEAMDKIPRDPEAAALGLTAQQEFAARWFSMGVSPRLAVQSAGYRPVQASEVLGSPRVHAYIEAIGRRLDQSEGDVALGVADRRMVLESMSEMCLDRNQLPQARAMAGKILLEHYERCGIEARDHDEPATLQEGIIAAYRRIGGPRAILSRAEMAEDPDYTPTAGVTGDG